MNHLQVTKNVSFCLHLQFGFLSTFVLLTCFFAFIFHFLLWMELLQTAASVFSEKKSPHQTEICLSEKNFEFFPLTICERKATWRKTFMQELHLHSLCVASSFPSRMFKSLQQCHVKLFLLLLVNCTSCSLLQRNRKTAS